MARATTTKAPKPAAKASQAPAGDQKTAEGIFVRSFPPTFRRAGFAFTSEGMGIALDAISAEQLQAIQDEPMLSVEFCDFPVDDTNVGAAEAGEQNSAE
ncbi:TPA: HI1506-related protein [Pseudomonas aeruginosa]